MPPRRARRDGSVSLARSFQLASRTNLQHLRDLPATYTTQPLRHMNCIAKRMIVYRQRNYFLRAFGWVLWACIGCGADVSAAPPGAIVNVWAALPPPSDAALPGLDEVALFERVTDRLEERFVLPRELRVFHLPCGTDQAFYEAGRRRIRMCDELLTKIARVIRAEATASEEDQLAQIRSTLIWMFLHEVGHAFIHIFDLPVLGQEEDAADGFAALALVDAGEATMARLAVDYWEAVDSGNHDTSDFADEHGLDLQRYYAGLCLVYGSDPASHQNIVEEGLLSAERAERCPDEYQQLLGDWKAVLGDRLRDPSG
jgi:hypothetical protein